MLGVRDALVTALEDRIESVQKRIALVRISSRNDPEQLAVAALKGLGLSDGAARNAIKSARPA